MERNEDERAIHEFRAAVRVAPKLADAYVKIGMIHQRRGRVSEAEIAYRAAIKLEHHALAYNNLAWMVAERLITSGDALVWATKAVSLAPRVPDFQDTLGWVHRARGDLKSAELVLVRVAASKPPRADFFYHLGVVRAEIGKRREALTAFNQALTLDSISPQAADARRRVKELMTAQ
jgi:Flp pilus assembly protein TadD